MHSDSKTANQPPVRVAVVGAGKRGWVYTRHAVEHPEELQVTAVADPREDRRTSFAREFAIEPAMQFESYEQLLEKKPDVHGIINGTMDRMHYPSTRPMLEAGYDVLLEKPIAPTEWETRDLIALADRLERKVMIGHVLRYSPFYRQVKRLVDQGAVGRILAMHSAENVAYHHFVSSFVRGPWNNRETSNPVLLAKCCHDLDILAWLRSGTPAARVASFGDLSWFKQQHAPAGSGTRCMTDCEIEPNCAYSARRHHLEHNRWVKTAFADLPEREHASDEQKREAIEKTSPLGRCVWRCDNNVVDHQNVIIQFADGVTATHDLFTNTAQAMRTIRIVGTKGELEGRLRSGKVTVRRLAAATDSGFEEQVIDVNQGGGEGELGGHGGGDRHLVADFVAMLRGQQGSEALTRIEDSLNGHLIAYAADQAMRENRVVEIAASPQAAAS